MQSKIITSSILDFPRKTLPKDLWVYDNPNELPKLKLDLRDLILNHSKKAAESIGLKFEDARLIGGSASYQWSPGTDIDVQIYVDWPDDISDEEVLALRRKVYKTKLNYQGYPITFFIKGTEELPNAAEAEYDIDDNEWTLPPLILPKGFDPDEYFAPLIRVADNRAKKFDELIGGLRRAWYALKKSSLAKQNARDVDVVENKVEKDKKTVKGLVEKISKNFDKVKESRRKLHDQLRDRLAQDTNIGRFERFQEPEIVWKYLDRAGYIDYLGQINKIVKDEMLDDILAKY